MIWGWICMNLSGECMTLKMGRFWQVNPLSDKYVHNSTYAFSENLVTTHIELEGLEAKYIFVQFKREVAQTFQTASNWFDKTFSFGSKKIVKTSVQKKPQIAFVV